MQRMQLPTTETLSSHAQQEMITFHPSYSSNSVLPLLLVGVFARLKLKINYYTLMGLLSGSMTNPPALGYSNSTAGNDMPAVAYATVYPVVMFLRVLIAQVLILTAL